MASIVISSTKQPLEKTIDYRLAGIKAPPLWDCPLPKGEIWKSFWFPGEKLQKIIHDIEHRLTFTVFCNRHFSLLNLLITDDRRRMAESRLNLNISETPPFPMRFSIFESMQIKSHYAITLFHHVCSVHQSVHLQNRSESNLEGWFSRTWVSLNSNLMTKYSLPASLPNTPFLSHWFYRSCMN